MKYGSRHSQDARRAANPDAKGKGSVSNTGSEGNTRRQPPAVIHEQSEAGDTLPLLSHLESETWLVERLKQHGHDIYAGGPYESYADRLGACIVRNGVASVIVGRNPAGKPESYQQLFERMYAKPLPKLQARRSTSPAAPVAGAPENGGQGGSACHRGGVVDTS